MLQNGTCINKVMIEKPHRFITACTIATQIILGVTSLQYGGATITLTHLAPFVRDEQFYLGLVTALTSTPYQYMAQLDDMGIDYETLSDYQFFSLMFILNSTNDLSLVFGDLKTQGYSIIPNDFNNTMARVTRNVAR